MDTSGSSASSSCTLTASAVEAVKNIRVKDGLGDQLLRVAVVGGGCSGFSYQLDFAEGPQDGDQVLEFGDLRVVVDGASAQYLAGVQIDYVRSLSGGGFKFQNPNATQTCGCGSSFST